MNDVAFRDRAVALVDDDVLVIADPHVGRDEASGASFPLGERADLHERLSALLAHFDPRMVVFAGDVIHTFDTVSDRSDASLDRLLATCREAGAEPALVAGNHDTALASAWDGTLHDEYVIGGESSEGVARTVVCHGHETPDAPAERYVIGHVHPAIEIEGTRHPCFLYGEGVYRGADLLVLPAFNRLAPGVVVNHVNSAAFDSPLVTDADRLEPIVYDPDVQEALRFPQLGSLRDVL